MSAWMFFPLQACIASASYSDCTVWNRFKYVINAAGSRVSFYTESIVWMWISGTPGKSVRVRFRTALHTALSRQMNQSFLDKVIPAPHLWWRCIRKCTRDSWSASKLICAFKPLQKNWTFWATRVWLNRAAATAAFEYSLIFFLFFWFEKKGRCNGQRVKCNVTISIMVLCRCSSNKIFHWLVWFFCEFVLLDVQNKSHSYVKRSSRYVWLIWKYIYAWKH